MMGWSTITAVPESGVAKSALSRFSKPLVSGKHLRDASDEPGARFDRATEEQIRAKLREIDAARLEADQKSRDSYLG
jgi:hypothetical protein